MLEQTYINLLRRFGLVLVVAAVLGAGSAYFLSGFIAPTYESTTTLLVTQPGANPAEPTDYTASARVAFVLQQLVETQQVLDRAESIGTTGLSAGEISRSVDVAAQEVFLRVTGSGSSPEAAQVISTTVSDAFTQVVNEGFVGGPITISVVEAAGLPSGPVSPKKTLNAAAGGMLGLVAAGALALLYVRLDDVVKDASQVRDATGLPTLGMLPAIRGASGPDQLHGAQSAGSSLTEAVRAVRANLSLAMGARPDGGFERSVVLVTGVREGDGGSVSAANLALAFGRSGYRTLLLECNFRNPSVQALFGLSGDAGLATILAARTDPDAAVQSTHHEGVFVLPAGYITPSSVDALGSLEMRDLVDHFRSLYDVVLMAAPATLQVPDAATLGPMSDLVLLVGWSGRTRGRDLQHSIEAMERSGGTPVGVILNGAGREKPSARGGQTSARQASRPHVEVASTERPE